MTVEVGVWAEQTKVLRIGKQTSGSASTARAHDNDGYQTLRPPRAESRGVLSSLWASALHHLDEYFIRR